MEQGMATKVSSLHRTLAAGAAFLEHAHGPAATADLLIGGARRVALGSRNRQSNTVLKAVSAVAFASVLETCHTESPRIAGLDAPVNGHKVRVEGQGGKSALSVVRETSRSSPTRR